MFRIWGFFNLLVSCGLCWMHQGGILGSFQVKSRCLWSSMGDSWMYQCLLLLRGHRCTATMGSGSPVGNCRGWGAETDTAQMALCKQFPKCDCVPPVSFALGQTVTWHLDALQQMLPSSRKPACGCAAALGVPRQHQLSKHSEELQSHDLWFSPACGVTGLGMGCPAVGQAEQCIRPAVTSFLCSSHQYRWVLRFMSLWTSHKTWALQLSSGGTLAFFLRTF